MHYTSEIALPAGAGRMRSAYPGKRYKWPELSCAEGHLYYAGGSTCRPSWSLIFSSQHSTYIGIDLRFVVDLDLCLVDLVLGLGLGLISFLPTQLVMCEVN